MTLKHFIERPVLASVISIVIVIAGLIGLATLPVEQYPDIAPPTVMVRASYPGASAETIQKSVIVPLEQAINGVEDMTYMTSSAAVGSASVTVYFRQGTNADMAAVNVQNKVSRATGQLPPEVTQIGVTTMKRQTSMVKIFSLYSPDDSYDEGFLAADPTLEIDPNTGHIVKDKPPENRCLIPTDMMDEYGIRLGDWIWLETITYPYTNSNDTQIIQVAFRVVGAFVQTGRANNIYANLDMPKYFLDLSMASVYEWSTQDLPGGTILTRGGICMRQAYSGATFSIPSCTDLTSVKQALHDMGLSEVGRISSIRNFVIINDAAYLTTERAAAQRLWYMQHLFPVVYAIALGLAYLLAFLQVQSRRRELRTMRSVGADRKTAYGSLFLEQLMLAALGAVLGAGLCLVLGWGSRLGLGLTAAFAVLWLLGAHVALCRANSRHILKNRREVE